MTLDIGYELREVLKDAVDADATAAGYLRSGSPGSYSYLIFSDFEKFEDWAGAPALIYDLVSETPYFTLSGDVGLERARVQIVACYPDSRTESVYLWGVARDYLLSYAGTPVNTYIRQITMADGHKYDRSLKLDSNINAGGRVVYDYFLTCQDFFVFYDSA